MRVHGSLVAVHHDIDLGFQTEGRIDRDDDADLTAGQLHQGADRVDADALDELFQQLAVEVGQAPAVHLGERLGG